MSELIAEEFTLLNDALKHVVERTSASSDPVLAGGVCILHKSKMLHMLSVESADEEFDTLNALLIALLGALVEQEKDPRVRKPLQQALQLTNQAQKLRLTPPNGILN